VNTRSRLSRDTIVTNGLKSRRISTNQPKNRGNGLNDGNGCASEIPRNMGQPPFEALYPSALKSLEDDVEASLNHLRVPAAHRKFVRTTNLLERTFEEERRRTKVIPRFWTEHSALKLIFGTLDRASRRWQRLTISEGEIKHLDQLRQQLGLDPSPERQTEQSREKSPDVA